MPSEITTNQPRSRASLLAMLITLGAFGWRMHGLGAQSLWRDEVDAVYFALRPLHETLAMFVQMAQNGPLFFASLRPWLQSVGSSEFALRFPSVVAGVLCAPLLWQVARKLLPARSAGAALLAALFLAVNPYQLWYSQEGKMYAIVTCLALAATWCWLVGIERGGWRPWLGYLVIVSAAIYTHLLMILLIPLHLLWFVIAWPQSKHHWKGATLALAGLTLPYLPMAWWQVDMLLANDRRTGFGFVALPEMLKTLLLNHTRGFMPSDELLWMAPIFFTGAAGLLLGVTELAGDAAHQPLGLSGWRRFTLIVTWLFAPIILIWLLSLRQPVYTDRYVIWVAPAAMLILALGVQVVRHSMGRFSLPMALMLTIYLTGYALFAGAEQKSATIKYDLRGAIHYVSQRRVPDTLLILQIPHLEYAFRYYSSDQGATPFDEGDARLGRWAGGLWTNGDAADDQARAEVDVAMRQLTANSNDVWLVLSEPEMWDQRRLMDEWLNRHASMVDQVDFHGLQVRHYQFSQE